MKSLLTQLIPGRARRPRRAAGKLIASAGGLALPPIHPTHRTRLPLVGRDRWAGRVRSAVAGLAEAGPGSATPATNTTPATTSARPAVAPCSPLRSPLLASLLLFSLSALLSFLLPLLPAQTPNPRTSPPRIGYVYPAGAQQGTTLQVTVGGQFLQEIALARFNGDGLSARVLSHQRPTTQKEDEECKAELEKLRAKRESGAPLTDDDRQRFAAIRAQLAYRMNRQTAPAICEALTLEITVAPDAPPGRRELRLRNPNGLSNPLAFHVGTLPEFSEPPAHPNTAAPEGRDPSGPRALTQSPLRTVTLPAAVNGQILPGEVDRIRFAAKKGQHLVIAARARELIPYLADAVPGWFQATLALKDAQGRELAYDDDYRFNPDPVLHHAIRADGDYTVEIKDSLYRGRQDFIYRITLGELPFITGIHPLGGRTGAKNSAELKGWNLPSAKAELDGTGKPPGKLTLVLERGGHASNEIAFALDDTPAVAEQEPNATSPSPPSLPASPAAQPLTLPAIIDGRIDRPGDTDTYAFTARAGDTLVVEVFARRLNSPLDSHLRLTDATGRLIAANDDRDDKASGLTTHHADSLLLCQLPADGTYHIQVSDTQHQGGPDHAYRLHVRPPRPGFELRVAPSALNLRTGAHLPVTVYALRHDGFTGPIELGLRDPSRAFGLHGARIPAGQDKIRLTLATAAPPRDEPYPLEIIGRATLGGKTVVRTAAPAEDMMQAFLYRHLVPAAELLVQVIGNGKAPKNALTLDDPVPLKIPAGGTATLRVTVRLGKAFEHFETELSEPPEGLAIQKSEEHRGSLEIVFTADAAKVKPGQQGNLIALVTAERVNADAKAAGEKPADKAKKKPGPRRIPISALPAIPYEIVAP